MSTTEDRRLLASNEWGSVLKLQLNQKSRRTAIAKALYKNTTVDTVVVFVEGSFIQDVSPDSLHNLFRAIGSLPLKSLTIYSFTHNWNPFPVQLLTDVISVGAKLEVLSLYFLELGGSSKSFEPFEEAVRIHPALKEIKVENCRLSTALLNSLSCDRFVKTLSTLPFLEKVEISASQMGYMGMITPKSLEVLAAQTECLYSLALTNCVFDNDHICALSRALYRNRDLTDLTLSFDPVHNTKLPALLATAKYLKNVVLLSETLDDETYIIKLAKGIAKSRSITRFELRGELRNRITTKAQRAFVAVLDQRPNLEHLDVPFSDKGVKIKAKLFMKLNQTGRRQIMLDPKSTKRDQVKALAYVREDLDCLFHFIRWRPSVCAPEPPKPKPKPPQEDEISLTLSERFTLWV